jgi:acetylornithine deacetylase/succinyl-diaminopimelate desuccinylase-like protein
VVNRSGPDRGRRRGARDRLLVGEVRRRVSQAVDALTRRIFASVGELIRVPSVNPNYPGVVYDEHIGGEARANDVLADLYSAAGCRVERVEIAPRRPNLVGILRGADPAHGRSLILNGHVDVVPAGRAEDWTGGDPWSGRMSDGRIWGRGASDQKAALVCAAMAAQALRDAGVTLAGDLILESVVGEEVGEHDLGTAGVIEAGYRADGAIVTEPTAPVSADPMHPPTSLLVSPVTAGLLWLTLEVVGRRGHNNLRPELVRAGGVGERAGVNAIEKGVYLLTALQDLEQQWGQRYVHPLFKPGHFSLHPGVITGGPHGAAVPFFISEFCRIEYSILYPPEVPVEAIKAEITTFVRRAESLDPWLADHPAELTWRFDWPPSVLAVEHPLTQAVVAARREAFGERAHQGPGPDPLIRAFDAVDDSVLFNQAGIPALSCGPGSIQFAHAVDENVATDELVAATRVYAYAAMDWCGLART